MQIAHWLIYMCITLYDHMISHVLHALICTEGAHTKHCTGARPTSAGTLEEREAGARAWWRRELSEESERERERVKIGSEDRRKDRGKDRVMGRNQMVHDDL